MKRKNRNVVLAGVICTGFIISCEPHSHCTSDDCNELYTEQAELNDLQLSANFIFEGSEAANTVDLMSLNVIEQSVDEQLLFVLSAYYDYGFYSENTYSQNFSFSLISKAYAESEPLTLLEFYDIESIEIYSESDFNALYPAGADLSELFLLERYRGDYGYPSNEFHADALMAYDSQMLQSVNAYFNETDTKKSEAGLISFKLSERPSLDQSHDFTIVYINENEQRFSFDVPTVNFLSE